MWVQFLLQVYSEYLIPFSVFLFSTPTPPPFLGTGSCYVAQAGPEAMILLHARVTDVHHHTLLMLPFLTMCFLSSFIFLFH